jgi:hypothetical protein
MTASERPKTRMVVCEICGAMALPQYMVSVINKEGKPTWLCSEHCNSSRRDWPSKEPQ